MNTPAAAFETSVIVPAPPVPSADDEPAGTWNEEAQAEPIPAESVESTAEIIATPVVVPLRNQLKKRLSGGGGGGGEAGYC